MSRYPPRIIINNPEKKVPEDIIEQFFLTVRSGNIDKIRDFTNMYKNKYNLVDKSGNTPAHAVLELDYKIADNDTKLRILKYLEKMGAPIDLPDSANVWPIHLAAALQSEEIVDFLVKKDVLLNRKDSSNNTPLHYAIIGREVSCPQPVKIKELIPPPVQEKKVLNMSLEDINKDLIQIISSNTKLNDNLIHIINTIMKIPQMYADDKFSRNLEKEVIESFTSVALSPGYQGGLTTQQQNLEQLVDRTYKTINDELLKGLTNPLNIAPNNRGWGPTITDGGTKREPTNMERILENDILVQRREIDEEYNNMRNNITSLNTSPTGNLMDIISTIDNTYINKLIFCTDCDSPGYGEDTALTKMFYLLGWNNIRDGINYSEFLTNKLMDTYLLMDNMVQQQLIRFGGKPIIHEKTSIIEIDEEGNETEREISPDFLIIGNISYLVSNLPNANKLDLAIANITRKLENLGKATYEDCIRNNLYKLFWPVGLPPEERKAVFIQNSFLGIPFNQLFQKPKYTNYREEFNRLRDPYKNFTDTWMTMLGKFINEIKPVPQEDVPNIFKTNGDYGLPDPTDLIENIGAHKLYFVDNVVGTVDEIAYTFLYIFYVMTMLIQYLIQGSYRIFQEIPTFSEPPNKWMATSDFLSNQKVFNRDGSIGTIYPEFIFLYKILVQHVTTIIRSKIINNCFKYIISHFKDLPKDDPDRITYDNFLKFDDSYILNLLLPSEPDNTTFSNVVNNEFSSLRNNKWNRNHPLVTWFRERFLKTNTFNKESFRRLVSQNMDSFANENYNDIRHLIEFNSGGGDFANIAELVRGGFFRNHIRKYFGTVKPPNPKKPFLVYIPNTNIVPNFKKLTDNIFWNLTNYFDNNLEQLRRGQLLSIFFMTETYSYLFVDTKRKLLEIISNNFLTGAIVADIITNINNNIYYYIPQVFLPALINQAIKSVKYLVDVNNNLKKFSYNRALFYENISPVNKNINDIIVLGDQFVQYITTQLRTIYSNVLDILKYHNSVVDFLNFHSAYLLQSQERTKLFTMNLIPLDTLPDIFTTTNFESLLSVLREYRIPKTIYYTDNNDKDKMKYNIFDYDENPDANGNYKLTDYRNFMDLTRSGQVSNSPNNGDNSQINIVAQKPADGTPPDPRYDILEIPNAIAGAWIQFNPDDPNATTFLDAFIAYVKGQLNLNWLDGMPPSIRQLAGRHLTIVKQNIVEEIVQYIIDNRSLDTSNPDSTKNLYNRVLKLGNETTYTQLSDVRVYVIIAKLTDAILNETITLATKQSVRNWVNNLTTGSSYDTFVNSINNTINLIKQKDYMNIYLKDMDKDAIKRLITTDPAYIDYRLSQIEPDASNIIYTSSRPQNEFIHYLYNLNYYPTRNISSNKKCYKINPDIARKLITADTINAKNSNGNTPLHYAVNIQHPGLVELLISRGAHPSSFKNILGKSPLDMALERATKHINYITGRTVSDSLKNFIIPFNDLLINRLRDERFGNNIVKNVTLAVPIQLVMFNHLIHIYLQNYQFGFSIELRNKMMGLFEKYFGIKPPLYPTDLFNISSEKLATILEKQEPNNRINRYLSTSNQKRLKDLQIQQDLLNNQINGLEKESKTATDSEQKQLVDNILAELREYRTVNQEKINSLQPTKTKVDPSIISSYETTFGSITRKSEERNTELTKFYTESFSRLGSNKELYLDIWNNYLEKDLLDAPTMVISLANKLVQQLLNLQTTKQFNAEQQSEFNTLANFFKKVKDYIEMKDTFPMHLDENRILKEEFEQIIYLINLILTPAVKNIIISYFYQGIREMDASNTLIKNEKDVYDKILSTEFNGYNIDKYLNDILPYLAAKYFTTIYRTADDPDRRITNSNDLFQPIVQIIKENKIVMLDENSTVVKNFKDNLVPYLANIYQNFIQSLRLSIYGYETYLLNSYQMSDILKHLI